MYNCSCATIYSDPIITQTVLNSCPEDKDLLAKLKKERNQTDINDYEKSMDELVQGMDVSQVEPDPTNRTLSKLQCDTGLSPETINLKRQLNNSSDLPSITDIPSDVDIASKNTINRKQNNEVSTNAGVTVQQKHCNFVIEVLLETLHADAGTVIDNIPSQSQQPPPTIEREAIPTIEEIIKNNTLDMKQSVAFEIMFCSFLLKSLETETIENGLINEMSNNICNKNSMDRCSGLLQLKKELSKRGGKIN